MKKNLFFLMLSSFVLVQTEMQSYSLIKRIELAEIRFYPPVMMAKHVSSKKGSGFGKLFEYISGNNTKNTKIAMTSPVHIENKLGESSMAFVLPRKFTGDNTPQPNDSSLIVFKDKGGYFAAIEYSGYTNPLKEKKHSEILHQLLDKENITPSGSAKILVYNSPYKIINRRNEILIPISFDHDTFE